VKVSGKGPTAQKKNQESSGATGRGATGHQKVLGDGDYSHNKTKILKESMTRTKHFQNPAEGKEGNVGGKRKLSAPTGEKGILQLESTGPNEPSLLPGHTN